MEETEQYEARIYAAMDKISQLIVESGTRDAEGDRLRQRDASLIEELEATIADERVDLDSERAANAKLRDEVAAAGGSRKSLEASLAEAKAALSEVQATQNPASEDVLAQLAEVQADHDDAVASLREAREAQQESQQALREAKKAQTAAESLVERLERQQNNGARASATMQDKVQRLNDRIASQDAQFQRLKGANTQLRDSNGLLRERNAENLGDASAIDQSMRAELEALRAVRAADAEEMDTILDELKPLLEGKIDA